MNSMHNFNRDKQRAIQQLREMNKRASVSAPKKEAKPHDIPHKRTPFVLQNFSFSMSDDELLFLGLLVILSKDCDDTLLFLALFYIFM